MQVSCQLTAWHTWFIVLCLHAGILSAYGMAHMFIVLCLHAGMQVSCQFMTWHTRFIVLCLHAGMQVSCQLMAWHTWFIVLCLRACILSAYGMAHMVYCLMSPYRYAGILSAYGMAHMVHCLMSPCRYAGILSAYGMAHMVHCLMSPCRYAGILSAYGMALADVVHEAQEPCALIYRSGRYSSLQHFTCLFKNSHEVCVWDKVVVVGGRGVMYINVFLLLLLLISVIRYLCDFKGRTGIKQVAWEQAKQYLNQRHCCLWTLETNNHVPFFQTTLRRLTNVWTTCQCSAWTDWCSKVFPGQFPCLFKEPLVMMMADSFWMRIWEGRGSSVAQHLVDVGFIIGRSRHKYYFWHERSFVATNMFVVTNTCLLWQNMAFVMTKLSLSWQNLCRNIFLSWQIFAATNIILSWQTHVCHDKTHLLSWQKYACHDKTFVTTKDVFYVCCDKFCRNKNNICGSSHQW